MDEHSDWEDVFRAEGAGGVAQDAAPRIRRVAYDADQGMTTYTFTYEPKRDPFEFEHVEEKGLFALTGPDGKIEYFRDRPTRYLVVEPDPGTGQAGLAISRGRPLVLWLCREVPEVRRGSIRRGKNRAAGPQSVSHVSWLQ